MTYIQSPNYPNGLPHRVSCTWFVRGPEDRRIKIEVEDLDLPEPKMWSYQNRTGYWCPTGLRVRKIQL